MAQAVRKIEMPEVEAEVVANTAPSVADIPREKVQPGESPARDLQARLEAEVLPGDNTMSARRVTAMVLVTCLATWVGGFMLYSLL